VLRFLRIRRDFTVDVLLAVNAPGCVVDGATVLAIVVATDVLELELLVDELELLEELDAVVDGVVVVGSVVVVGRAFIDRTLTAVLLLF
jgi:hypothetical protein